MTRTLDGLESALAVCQLSSPPYFCLLSHFTFWISLSLRANCSALVSVPGSNYNQARAPHITVYGSLHNVITDVIADVFVFLCLFMTKRKIEVLFVHQNLISN